MSNITGDDESFSSPENNTGGGEEVQQQQLHRPPPASQTPPPPVKKKRSLPGTPVMWQAKFLADPAAEVIALSAATLMATNRFVCEICSKGFQRDQNLQLHRRGHNLPWKLRQRATAEARKRVYICPEPSCVHHSPGRALGDLTGIKKHFCRKHGEKKWKCDKCSKKYAVQSDCKAHSKTCGTREHKCDCGTIFCRRDSFITHRAFCDALVEEENNKSSTNNANAAPSMLPTVLMPELMMPITTAAAAGGTASISISDFKHHHPATTLFSTPSPAIFSLPSTTSPSPLHLAADMPRSPGPHMSATALLQKAAQMGATASGVVGGGIQQQVVGPAYSTPEGLGMMDGGISSGGGGGVYGHAMNHQMFDGRGGDQGMHVFGDHHHHHQSNNRLLMKSLEQERQLLQHASSGAMTLDFLGLGGARPAATMSLQQQFEGAQGGLHHHFHHHHHQQMDKALWGDL